jgi:hypothetical protein
MAIGDETCEQMDAEVVGTAVARVLDLAHVLELIDDGLDEGACAQEQLVAKGMRTLRIFLRSLVMSQRPCARKSCSASGAEM